jgi:hypothetical protein
VNIGAHSAFLQDRREVSRYAAARLDLLRWRIRRDRNPLSLIRLAHPLLAKINEVRGLNDNPHRFAIGNTLLLRCTVGFRNGSATLLLALPLSDSGSRLLAHLRF